MAGYETYSMFGLFATARTPAETIKKIGEDVTEIIMRPEVKAQIAARGFEVQGKALLNFSRSSIKTPSSGRRSSRLPSSKRRSRTSRQPASRSRRDEGGLFPLPLAGEG